MRKIFGWILVVGFASVSAVCGGSEPDSIESTTTPGELVSASSAVPTATPESSSEVTDVESGGGFTAALASLPNNSTVRSGVWLTDYWLAAELLNIERPGPSAPDNEISAYVFQMTVGADFRSPNGLPRVSQFDGFGRFESDISGWRESAGFTSSDVMLSIHAGIPGADEDQYDVIIGRFDPVLVEAAVRNDEVWGPLTEEKESSGFTYLSWGSSTESDLSKQSKPLRPSGRGHQLSIGDDELRWTLSEGRMQELLDASQDPSDSLKSNHDFELIAELMDSKKIFAGYITDQTLGMADHPLLDGSGYGLSDSSYRQIENFLATIALDPFEAYGIGISADAKGFIVAMAITYADPGVAERNVDGARALIEEGVTANSRTPLAELLVAPEVQNDGRLVFVTARIDDPELWTIAYEVPDPLLFHE